MRRVRRLASEVLAGLTWLTERTLNKSDVAFFHLSRCPLNKIYTHLAQRLPSLPSILVTTIHTAHHGTTTTPRRAFPTTPTRPTTLPRTDPPNAGPTRRRSAESRPHRPAICRTPESTSHATAPAATTNGTTPARRRAAAGTAATRRAAWPTSTHPTRPAET